MPRQRPHPLATLLLAMTTTAGGGAAQTRVTLQARGKPDAVTQQVLRLSQESSRVDATMLLLRIGRPAVPLLARAAEADDAASMPALRVLAELGPRARPARAALLRLGEKKTALGRAALEVLAAIGERDSVLFCDWQQGCITELDADGFSLRQVTVHDAWRVQPVANDHLLVCLLRGNAVTEIDWEGNEIASWPCTMPFCAQRRIDGTIWVSDLTNHRMRHLTAEGAELGAFEASTRAFRLLPDDHVMMLLGNSLREVTTTGEPIRELPTADTAYGFDLTADGGYCVVHHGKLTALTNAGVETVLPMDPPLNGTCLTVAALPDGRHFVGGVEGMALRDPGGAILWHHPCGAVSCIVPRIDVPDAK